VEAWLGAAAERRREFAEILIATAREFARDVVFRIGIRWSGGDCELMRVRGYKIYCREQRKC
jgi:hypothetical protein